METVFCTAVECQFLLSALFLLFRLVMPPCGDVRNSSDLCWFEWNWSSEQGIVSFSLGSLGSVVGSFPHLNFEWMSISLLLEVIVSLKKKYPGEGLHPASICCQWSIVRWYPSWPVPHGRVSSLPKMPRHTCQINAAYFPGRWNGTPLGDVRVCYLGTRFACANTWTVKTMSWGAISSVYLTYIPRVPPQLRHHGVLLEGMPLENATLSGSLVSESWERKLISSSICSSVIKYSAKVRFSSVPCFCFCAPAKKFCYYASVCLNHTLPTFVARWLELDVQIDQDVSLFDQVLWFFPWIACTCILIQSQIWKIKVIDIV